MIVDPGNQYIHAIHSHIPLSGKTILEIGCGAGRITRDMAESAHKIVATDMNQDVLEQAEKRITRENVEFFYTPTGIPDLPPGIFDIVVYTLSLHHIPQGEMRDNLLHSGKLLQPDGKIVVIEPGKSGSFMEVKRHFGAGSGDEAPEKQAAVEAMQNLDGWLLSRKHHFEVQFQFTGATDFITNKLPNHASMPEEKLAKLIKYLNEHTTEQGIFLSSERCLYLLQRADSLKN